MSDSGYNVVGDDSSNDAFGSHGSVTPFCACLKLQRDLDRCASFCWIWWGFVGVILAALAVLLLVAFGLMIGYDSNSSSSSNAPSLLFLHSTNSTTDFFRLAHIGAGFSGASLVLMVACAVLWFLCWLLVCILRTSSSRGGECCLSDEFLRRMLSICGSSPSGGGGGGGVLDRGAFLEVWDFSPFRMDVIVDFHVGLPTRVILLLRFVRLLVWFGSYGYALAVQEGLQIGRFCQIRAFVMSIFVYFEKYQLVYLSIGIAIQTAASLRRNRQKKEEEEGMTTDEPQDCRASRGWIGHVVACLGEVVALGVSGLIAFRFFDDFGETPSGLCWLRSAPTNRSYYTFEWLAVVFPMILICSLAFGFSCSEVFRLRIRRREEDLLAVEEDTAVLEFDADGHAIQTRTWAESALHRDPQDLALLLKASFGQLKAGLSDRRSLMEGDEEGEGETPSDDEWDDDDDADFGFPPVESTPLLEFHEATHEREVDLEDPKNVAKFLLVELGSIWTAIGLAAIVILLQLPLSWLVFINPNSKIFGWALVHVVLEGVAGGVLALFFVSTHINALVMAMLACCCCGVRCQRAPEETRSRVIQMD